MDEKRSLADALNATAIKFLLSDMDFAMTLMDVASMTSVEETMLCNHESARKAYDAVLCHLSKVKLNAIQQHSLDEKLAILKVRLQDVGQKF